MAKSKSFLPFKKPGFKKPPTTPAGQSGSAAAGKQAVGGGTIGPGGKEIVTQGPLGPGLGPGVSLSQLISQQKSAGTPLTQQQIRELQGVDPKIAAERVRISQTMARQRQQSFVTQFQAAETQLAPTGVSGAQFFVAQQRGEDIEIPKREVPQQIPTGAGGGMGKVIISPKEFQPIRSTVTEFKPTGIKGLIFRLRKPKITFFEGGPRKALPRAEKISDFFERLYSKTTGRLITPVSTFLKKPFEQKLEAEFKGTERRREQAEKRLKEFITTQEKLPAQRAAAFAERIQPSFQKRIEEGEEFGKVQKEFEDIVTGRFERGTKTAEEGFKVLEKEVKLRFEEEKRVKTKLPTQVLFETPPGGKTKQLRPKTLSFIIGTGLEEGAKFVLPPFPSLVGLGTKGLAIVSEPPTRKELQSAAATTVSSFKFSPTLFIGTAVSTAAFAGGISKLTRPTRIKIGAAIKGRTQPIITEAKLRGTAQPLKEVFKGEQLTVKVRRPFAPGGTPFTDIAFKTKPIGIKAKPLKEIFVGVRPRVDIVPKAARFPPIVRQQPRPIPKQVDVRRIFGSIGARPQPKQISFVSQFRRVKTPFGFQVFKGEKLLFQVGKQPIRPPRPKVKPPKGFKFVDKEIKDSLGRIQIQRQVVKLETLQKTKQKLKTRQKVVLLQKQKLKTKQKLSFLQVSALKTAQLQKQMIGQQQTQKQLQKQKQAQVQALKPLQKQFQIQKLVSGQAQIQKQRQVPALFPAMAQAQAQDLVDVDITIQKFKQPKLEIPKRFIVGLEPRRFPTRKKKKKKKKVTRPGRFQPSLVAVAPDTRIFGRIPKRLTGLEVRPIPIKKML